MSAGCQYEAQASGLLGHSDPLHAEQDLRRNPLPRGLEGARRSASPCLARRRCCTARSATRHGDPMELFSASWLSALAAIVLIDLVLAGDNAIVIALAARKLPPRLQRRAIVWGTLGAVVVRSAMTLAVVWLLRVPGLMLVGGLGLVWIAYKLLLPTSTESGHGEGANSFWGAMKTIVVADALMGIDNVLGVAGAAHGAFDLVVIGLLISVPIVVWGSTLVLKLVERFPVIINLGAAVLAFTAAKMIVSEPLLDAVYDPHALARIATYAVLVVGVLAAGRWAARRAPHSPAA